MKAHSIEAVSDHEMRIAVLESEIDALKRNQLDFEKAKELYLKIFEDFPALIWRAGLDKLCNYFNHTWLEFTGKTLEEEIGNGWAEGVHPDDFQFCLDTYVAKFDLREPFHMEYRLLNKNKEYRWIRDYGRPFYDVDGTFLGYIGSCYDITPEKEHEKKMEELNVAKNRFMSILAHDLINPFHYILGSSEILIKNEESVKAENVNKIAHNIHNCASRTFELLQNLLEWGNFQLENKVFSPRNLNLAELVHQSIEQIKPIADAKSLTIHVYISHEIHLWGDEYMLKVVFRNLITNAIKFSFEKSEIEISAVLHPRKAIITIRDFGVGMDDCQLSKLFKLAEKASTYGTHNEKGVGLGLVLCKDFVEFHGGEIWAESDPGEGSRFIFTLPLTAQNPG